MAAKNAKKPRPNKNSDGQDKKPTPTMSVDHHVAPGEAPQAPTPPGMPPPGTANPMTHPHAPAIQSSMGTGQSPAAGPPQQQVQTRIQFKDLPPPGQAQLQEQQGIDPYAPIKQAQQSTEQALAQGPTSGPVPNQLSGPYLPPDVAAFPDDMAHLTTLMGQGFAPGASGQEHEFAQNAHAMAHAKIQAAMQRAQNGAGTPSVAPPSAPPPAPPMAPPAAPPMAPPPMGSSMGVPPPTQPGAPSGIPPEIIAAMIDQHKKKQPTR